MRPQPYLEPMQIRGRIATPQPLGLPIINLGFNELPYPPTPGVADALARAETHVQSYGNPHCNGLREALGARFGVNPDAIICGNGSEELLDVIARTFARPDDEILISQYGYVQFALTANRVGASLAKAPEAAMTSDIDALLAAVSDRTRLLFLANPNNPTGTMVPAAELRRLAAALPDHIVLVLDIAYGEFAGSDYCADVHAIVADHENVVVTRTFSKAYGLAGARVGWAHGPDWLIPVLYAARGMGTVNALAQAAAIAALGEVDTVDQRVAEIVAERERVTRTLNDLGLATLPSQANFLMATIRGGDAALTEALVQHLFDTGGIIVNRTREAGLEAYFRFSLGLSVHNDLLLECIRKFLAMQEN